MTADQRDAFWANGGFEPAALSTLLLGVLLATLLLWAAWALRTAYVSWAEQRLNQRQFMSVVVKFVAIYLALTFFFFI